ncbi:anti-sigma factor [Rathayibacter toxicus]|uniref:Anti-sigma K factor RskA C-terminal domain-containing protein n=1 Tax=Rathayibacter toxicus TaxID=145458 RepID=A0A2S5Y8Z5_9MICO|nr:anti-sigma factor [Rathayibacter toxicus]ALS56906.1 hypothetical protein APU90_03270 [Rathayibacter toxicus]PPG23221.1 hypothetical protein C5D15_02985 [Rathayibacter toxicus]PPG47805.1 hypothetical protein C5D16_02980 [Rathayibacter toxicus]PPH24949.1 hypothetical protein C5D17_02965 [Rathayibacter toxicus]PPH58873.1 hypothetical protein C5D30_02980 [Rathayibacter toxicus]
MNDARLPDGSDEPRDLAAGHALRILSAEEQARYEQFLVEHLEARREAAALREVADALAADVSPVEPSPALKAELMALIANTPQLSATDSSDDVEAPIADEPQSVNAQETPSPSRVAETSGGAQHLARQRWYTHPALYLSAAAAAAVIVVGGATLPPQLSAGADSTQEQTVLAQVRSASDAQEVSGSVTAGTTATLVWSNSLGRSVLLAEGLALLPEDKTYQLWYLGSSGQTVAAGTFDGGDGSAVIPLQGAIPGVGSVVAVTIEQAGGSKTPTTRPILTIGMA